MKTTPVTERFAMTVQASPRESVLDLDRGQIIELIKTWGVVVFRGYGVDLQTFNRFTDRFSTDYMSYRGGGYIRRQVNDGEDETLLSVSYDHGRDKQDTFGLPLHGEMYYVDNRPVLLWFYCVRPAQEDGETTICDGSQVYERLSEASKQLLQEKRVKYTRKYLDGEWQKIYQTDDIDDAAAFGRANGLEVDVDRMNKSIRTEYIHPAIITSRWGNYTVYINNVLPVLWQESMGRETSIVRFEDGSKIPEELVDEVLEIQKELVLEISWASGDFAVIDNTRSHHGRRAFTDAQREIYLRMVRSVAF